MTSILKIELSATSAIGSLENLAREPEQDTAPEPPTGTSEYEIVLGKAQIASWLFVGVIAAAVCTSLAYLAGETIATKKAPAISRSADAPVQAPPPSITAELPEASILVTPKTDVAATVKPADKPAPPIFAEPETGKIYLQVSAMGRGMAMILAEGLRSHGFDSFIAPGPNGKIFRVLIGPLPDPQASRQAMAAMNALDLATFVRKYQAGEQRQTWVTVPPRD
jgi:cell division septation protein DedD